VSVNTPQQPPRGLLDTSTVIAIETGRTVDYGALPAEHYVSVVTLAELNAGVHTAPDVESRASRVASLNTVSKLNVLAIDSVAASQSGRLRARLNEVAVARGLPLQATGCGSLLNLHFHRGPIRNVQDLAAGRVKAERRGRLNRLFHLDMIAAGQYLALRGFMALSLPITDADCERLVAAVDEFLSVRGPLVEAAATHS